MTKFNEPPADASRSVSAPPAALHVACPSCGEGLFVSTRSGYFLACIECGWSDETSVKAA